LQEDGRRFLSGGPRKEGRRQTAVGKTVETDYLDVMEFDGDRIRHRTKIWNDGFAMRQLGWG